MANLLIWLLELSIPDDVLLSRINDRLIHPASGRVYNLTTHPPRVFMKDDITGEPLIQRSDDNTETFIERLNNYHDVRDSVIEYYKNRGIAIYIGIYWWLGILSVIDAAQNEDIVRMSLCEIFDSSIVINNRL